MKGLIISRKFQLFGPVFDNKINKTITNYYGVLDYFRNGRRRRIKLTLVNTKESERIDRKNIDLIKKIKNLRTYYNLKIDFIDTINGKSHKIDIDLYDKTKQPDFYKMDLFYKKVIKIVNEYYKIRDIDKKNSFNKTTVHKKSYKFNEF